MTTSMLIGFITVAFLFFIVGKILFNAVTGNRGKLKHCMTCGADTQIKNVTKGNTLMELVLWLCFLVPGLIYSIWRVSSRYEGCGTCGATTVVPMDSPAAVGHRKSMGIPAITA